MPTPPVRLLEVSVLSSMLGGAFVDREKARVVFDIVFVPVVYKVHAAPDILESIPWHGLLCQRNSVV